VENRTGKGRTLLIGTFPGAGYGSHHTASARAFFAGLLKMGDVEPGLHTDNPAVQARRHSGKGGEYLWVVNPSRSEAKVTVAVKAGPDFRKAEDVWGQRPVTVGERSVTVSVGARDAAVIALR
jgi:beta-galactosidase